MKFKFIINFLFNLQKVLILWCCAEQSLNVYFQVLGLKFSFPLEYAIQ